MPGKILCASNLFSPRTKPEQKRKKPEKSKAKNTQKPKKNPPKEPIPKGSPISLMNLNLHLFSFIFLYKPYLLLLSLFPLSMSLCCNKVLRIRVWMLFWTTELRCLYQSWVILINAHHHLEFLLVRIHHIKVVAEKAFQSHFLIDLPRYAGSMLFLYLFWAHELRNPMSKIQNPLCSS